MTRGNKFLVMTSHTGILDCGKTPCDLQSPRNPKTSSTLSVATCGLQPPPPPATPHARRPQHLPSAPRPTHHSHSLLAHAEWSAWPRLHHHLCIWPAPMPTQTPHEPANYALHAPTSLELRVVMAHFLSSDLFSSSALPSRDTDSSRTLDTASWDARRNALMMLCSVAWVQG